MTNRIFPLLLIALLIAGAATFWTKPRGMPVKEFVQEKIEEVKEVAKKEADPFSAPAQTARAIHFQCPEVNLNERKSKKLPPLTGLAGMNVAR